jgi:hypothetical protein
MEFYDKSKLIWKKFVFNFEKEEPNAEMFVFPVPIPPKIQLLFL